MEGGCIDIWILKDLDFRSKWRLIQYAEILSKEFVEYSLELKPVKFPENHLKAHFKQQIGQIPELMITICGFADPIFITAEHILNKHEGWFLIGIENSKNNIQDFDGKAVKRFDDNDLKDDGTYLVDGEFMSSYINNNIDINYRKRFSYENIMDTYLNIK